MRIRSIGGGERALEFCSRKISKDCPDIKVDESKALKVAQLFGISVVVKDVCEKCMKLIKINEL